MRRSSSAHTLGMDKRPTTGSSPTRNRPLPASISRTLDMLPAVRRYSDGTTARAHSAAPTRSAVVGYETALVRSAQSADSATTSVRHSTRCFGAFDEVIPKLGVYTRVAKVIRDELFDAVHSDEYTSEQYGQHQRVPYYVLVGSMRKAENDAAAAAVAEADKIRAEVAETGSALAASRATIASLQAELANVGAKIAAAKATTEQAHRDHRAGVDTLHATINGLHSTVAGKDDEIAALNARIAKQEDSINRAAPHIEAFDTIERAFDLPFNAANRTTKVTHMNLCKKGGDQAAAAATGLLYAYNDAVRRFEDKLMDAEAGVIDIEGGRWHTIQKRFVASVGVVNTATPGLKAHQDKLADQLAHLSAQDPVDYLVDGQFDINYVVSLDRLHTVMEISDDAGQSFRQYKGPGTWYDQSWNAYTIVHPATVQIMPDVTHVRFKNPQAPLHRDHGLGGASSARQDRRDPEAEAIAAAAETVRAASAKGVAVRAAKPGGKDKPEAIDAKNGKTAAAAAAPKKAQCDHFRRIVHTRCTDVKALPRSLPTHTVDLMIESFFRGLSERHAEDTLSTSACGSELSVESTTREAGKKSKGEGKGNGTDAGAGAGAATPLATDLWFQFLETRYNDAEVSLAVARDVMTHVEENYAENLHSRMLSSVLNGNSSVAATMYFFELRARLRELQWTEPEKTTRAIIAELYAFLTSEEQDDVLLNMQSTCSNKLSVTAVETYAMSMVLRDAPFEPRMVRSLARLGKCVTTTEGVMDLSEFEESLLDVAPTIPSETQTFIYVEMEHNFRTSAGPRKKKAKGVPNTRCAEAATYIELLADGDDIFEAIADRVSGVSAEARHRKESARSLKRIKERQARQK